MSGVELVAGIIAAFFAFGIAAGVLAVIALSAVRGRRIREDRRYRVGPGGPERPAPVDRTGSAGEGRPSGPDWADRPGWAEPPGPDDPNDPPSRWPGGYHGLATRG